MPSTLTNLYKSGTGGLNTAGQKAFFGNPFSDRALPNAAGTYNPASTSGPVIKPAPVFTGIKPTAPAAKPAADTTSSFYDKYKDPKTGKIMTPEEYAIYLGNKVPKGNGEITNYAGDALTNPNQSATELTTTARNLNTSRNDIATGAADPYKVGNQSGVAYSPTELAAIEKAYAGVYDPALNDVFTRLKATQDKEEAAAKRIADKEDRVFATNEAIRQWRATTGTTPGATGAGKEKDRFTSSQLNDGASNAGLSLSAFDSLDDDIKNFYINTPMAVNDEDKKVPIYDIFNSDFAKVTAGELTPDELSADITGSTLPPAVKHYFIDQIPDAPEKKEKWYETIWNGVKLKLGV
jgi:hypothetical protein